MRRLTTVLVLSTLALSGCAGDPTTDDLCGDSSRCTPDCGSVARGGSPECVPFQREGRTRG